MKHQSEADWRQLARIPDHHQPASRRHRLEQPRPLAEIDSEIAGTEADAVKLDDTHLYNYYFGWGPDGKAAAIALGYGSLYNHADDPNAAYRKDPASGTIIFAALRAIAAGEEIFVRYNYPAAGQGSRLWFDIR